MEAAFDQQFTTLVQNGIYVYIYKAGSKIIQNMMFKYIVFPKYTEFGCTGGEGGYTNSIRTALDLCSLYKIFAVLIY